MYACLRDLAARRASGLVESAVLIGAPVPADAATWAAMRAVVAGRLVNVWSARDYLLAFVYRATSLQYGVAGLQAIPGVPGVLSIDMSAEVNGRVRYPALLGVILRRAGVVDVRPGVGLDGTDMMAAATMRTADAVDGQEMRDVDPDAKEVSREVLAGRTDLLGDLRGEGVRGEIFAGVQGNHHHGSGRGSMDLLEMLEPLGDGGVEKE